MNGPVAQLQELCCRAHIPDMNDVMPRIQEICERYQLAELSIFGSVSRGTATEASDIDLLYRFKEGARPGFRFFELERELSSVFDRRVDLLAESTIPMLVRDAVLAESIVVYAA